MKKKRERLDVIKDILKTVKDKEKIGPTRLLQLSNLSAQMFKDYLEDLVSSELLKEEMKNNKKTYQITSKGEKYLQQYKQFIFFITELGL